MLKKGPEIKMPDVKVPQALRDLYLDLRERRLLPLVGLLVAAILIVPIAMGGSSDEFDAAGGQLGEANARVSVAGSFDPEEELVVTRVAPGLRDYRRRLEGRARDPFEQKYTTPVEGTEDEGAGASETVEGRGETATITSEEGSTTITTEPEGGGETATEDEIFKFYSYAIDVRVVPISASKGGGEPTVRRDLPELTVLPSREVPAVVFIGPSKDAKKAIMLVSDNVTGVFGDAVCVLGRETCQMLALEPGVPETFVYGADERTFRITLLKMQLVATDKLNRAPLGKSKGKDEGDRKPGRGPQIAESLGAGSQPR